ncbi:bifunctional diaminohydroxyphosphoribosylaminopyrimidine deaminase/5-amino-6-(5-phosphoribosylamino)uracil reductase RibD [Prosthecodimorpha staleyi]|uniref:Riboflavin biosynthesis protein RibD n=1 Tax=Prosthecodimorpha staleyi TaxID=2840188 RepID=A0A947GD90_9HYPH|nr:bifunctional diaminohydroxyphosphoribosylaminopyrimidine deaminase/5-amino-6-(5-phosphoribosylamino)uracil reductase RibD [Prosthecodimorpha staleyi]MBT9290031.1 bifunctional diaminohydroxyphosphoribosylaminopyrimidine deaminase/5-amino-6-(5-phosphoribosylamino)uracil reductase RibD [Prosthecodimorpha staleyi]
MSAGRVSDLDRRFMDAAVRMGRRHLGLTRPNPSVGAVVVRAGPDGPEVVGRGTTAHGGRPHAERIALAEAGERARGATLYVTLEPCSQHGKPTPGCAEAILEAGIARVVTAQEDPDSRVAGRGHAMLRAAGVEVVVGVGAAEAERGLANHFTRMRRGRPRMILKLAVSADGMIGRRGVAKVPVTGDAARAYAQVLRSEVDAVMVGIGTALVDDPDLTVRLPGMEGASPARIVVDSHARLPLESRLVRSAGQVPVHLLTTEKAPRSRIEALRAAGVDIVMVPMAPDGHVDLVKGLTSLSWKGIPSVLVEGGSDLAEALLSADLVDEVALFRSSAVIGASGVAAPASLEGLESGRDGRYQPIDRRRIGEDRLVTYRRLGR